MTENKKTYTNSRRAAYRRGELIVRRGDGGDDIFILLAGSAEVTRYDSAGKGYVTATLNPGQAFGEMAFIMEEPRDLSVRALTDIEVEIVSSRVFAELYDLEGIGPLIRPIIQAFVERLRSSYTRISEMEIREGAASEALSLRMDQWEVIIIPRTGPALQAMNGEKRLSVARLPFYIGRYSQRRSDMLFHANALVLKDRLPYTISRSHCALAVVAQELYFVDRGSTLGSVVNGARIGGDRQAAKSAVLAMGDNEVIFGDSDEGDLAFTVSVRRR